MRGRGGGGRGRGARGGATTGGRLRGGGATGGGRLRGGGATGGGRRLEVVERPAASASQTERASSATTSSATTSSSTTSSSTTSGPRRQRASYGRRYVETRGFARERAANRPLYTGLRDINPVWRVLLPRLAEKARLDWRSPDAPFWVIQSKNTANNGVKYHAGRLLATYESGCAYELELGPELRTLGPCDFDGTLKTFDFWTDTMTAHAKTCATTSR